MAGTLLLGVFVVAAAVGGPRLLLSARWVEDAPGWGICAWQALTFAITSAVVLFALTVGAHDLSRHYGVPVLALAVGVAVLVRIGWAIGTTLHRSRRRRLQQLQSLALVGIEHPDGYVVVEHPVSLVYCLPGRPHRVVVTRGALDSLSDHELRVVLAHERAHLRVRHDIAVGLSAALARAFGGVRVFRTAHEQVARLVELQADDAATLAADRRALATALMQVSDSVGHARAMRLTREALPRRRRHGVAVGVAALALVAAPLALVLTPGVGAAGRDCCPAAVARLDVR
ncbi:M56 family metallopeptidase [Nocardioides marmoriginsengisoli]|nr:M56 family metallopeptidase [Nocardioides marmoriginsengisoli]